MPFEHRLISMAIGKTVDAEDLGGWRVHSEVSGIVDQVVDTDEQKGVTGKVMNWLNAMTLVTVPKISVVMRKSYGLAVSNMGAGGNDRAMDRYDPEIAPNPEDWLALDEEERVVLVEWYHRDARIDLPKAARTLHATIHVVVENQLVENDEPVTRALTRLMKEGLSRHEAVHAIGSVVAEEIYDALKLKDTPESLHARCYAAIERLTAAVWRDKGDG